ncbi:MAG: hypothetical protein MJ191_06840 [Clostridium sp.]|nr:hypothetical protein [Clostridium sp.]
MIHTLMITHRILSYKMFEEIYKELEARAGKKARKVHEGCYRIEALKEEGFTHIILTNKKIDSKYKYNFMQITIILNPVKLIRSNKLNVIKQEHIEIVKKIFSKEIKKIHTSLPRLEHWTINRIDYAVNINTPYVEEYIKLFQRADKPRNFKELYCSKSKTRKQRHGSFYLISKSVNINFYNKEHERLSQNFNKDGAKDLLRLEVQCKKPKTNTIKAKNGFESKHLEHYLSNEISNQQLEYYYNKTIGTGDYYKLSEAIRIVQDSNSTIKTKEKLINVLRLINKHRSIWRAREESQYNSSCFNRYLKKIRVLGVNPVTIPSRWGVNMLKNTFL